MKNERIIKTVAPSGQIFIGKEWAGQQIQIEKREDNVLIITRGQFIPDNERWLHQDDNLKVLYKNIAESKKLPRSDNYEEIRKRILSDD